MKEKYKWLYYDDVDFFFSQLLEVQQSPHILLSLQLKEAHCILTLQAFTCLLPRA